MTNQVQPKYVIRPVRRDDVPYLMSTWLRGLRSQLDPLPDDLFFGAYRPLLVRLLACSQTRVAEATDGRKQPILGFSVTWDSDGVLHWVYVRDKERGQGLGKALIAHLPATPPYTLRTWSARTSFRQHLGQHRPSLLHGLKAPST